MQKVAVTAYYLNIILFEYLPVHKAVQIYCAAPFLWYICGGRLYLV